jgi:hypothetical protein
LGAEGSTSKSGCTDSNVDNTMIVAFAETSSQESGSVFEMDIDEGRGAT